ncbi:MAG TPA: response regulator [Candidatus Acidoferrales bacterium]|jgi:CheY-like chemotaxis protein|nr:response regulator [Candidatus Acidoferrales bacterium]
MQNQKNLGKRILLVDDEPSVSKAIKMLLEYDGFTVQTAENGEAALALFEQDQFDLVITDFSMHGMTGGQLAARIKQLRPGQPVILATASIYKLEEAKHPARIVDYILDKPFGLRELREAIASIFP